jgi:RNA polymerase sigma factor (sigma-70 family)
MSYEDSISDEELMELYRKGHTEAFNTLYVRHSAKVYGYLQGRLKDRFLVDEVFQNVFLKLHKSREKYDSAFPFLPWLFTISRTALLDHYRQISRRRNEELVDFPAEPAEPVDQPKNQKDLNEQVPAVLDLPERQRQAIELRYGKNLTFEELAKHLDVSPSNARQIVSRAIRKMKDMVNTR